MADTAVPQFSLDDLKTSVTQLHDALNNGGNESGDVARQCLALLDKCVGYLARVQENQVETRKSYRTLREGQHANAAHMLLLDDKLDAVLQGTEALLKVNLRQMDSAPGRSGAAAKSRLSVIASRDRTAPPASDGDPGELIRKGLAQQLIGKMFGPKGGYEATYDAQKAAAMLMKGELTRAQHRAWKISGRLPDHVEVS